MRWLIVGDEWPTAGGSPGGVGEWTFLAASALFEVGAVEVFVRHRPDLRPFPGLRGVRGPSFGRWGGVWTGLATRSAVDRADAVLCATWPVATRIVHPRLHVVAHGSDITRPTRDPGGRERVFGRATGWAVSAFLADQVAGARVLPVPIEPAPPRRLRSALRTLGLVARATPLKGGDRFIRLVHAAGLAGRIAGDGPELPAWRALAAQLGARVTFDGSLPHAEMPAFYESIDAAVLTPRPHRDGSGAEGLGLCLLEAAAHSVPTVGCRTGGVPEASDLLLDDPDDSAQSARALQAWWNPQRGNAARDRLAQGHGRGRMVALLSGGG